MSNPNEVEYLYCFGHETPNQIRNNKLFGWDDQDCQLVRIRAGSEDEAMAWGCEIAEQFMKRLFKDDEISWKKIKYGHGIESPSECLPAAVSRSPLVSFGEMPDLDWMVKDALRQSF